MCDSAKFAIASLQVVVGTVKKIKRRAINALKPQGGKRVMESDVVCIL